MAFSFPSRRAVVSTSIAAVTAIALSMACHPKAPAARPAQNVEVTTVLQRDVPIVHEWIGTLDGFVNADIRPEIEGYVLRQVYREGSPVRRGELLFLIDARPFQAALEQAKAGLARDEAALAKARLDVERFIPLVSQKAVSQQELDNALAAQRVAEATAHASKAALDRAQLNLDWTRMTSPIDGIAGIAKAQVGNLVNGQTLMTTVSTVDPIKVYFKLGEQEFLAWERARGPMTGPGGPADKNSLELVLSDGSVYPARGNPILVDRSVDALSGTITLAGLFPNPEHLLRPGQYAKVRSTTEIRRAALLVPQRAVSELQGNFQVAVVGPDNKVELRPVKTGERVGSLWVIEQGLRPGERVIVEGTQKVATGTLVNPRFAIADIHPETALVQLATAHGQ